MAGIALGIFIGQTRTHGLHNLVRHEVFRSNQFDTFLLALMLTVDNVENLAVALHNIL